MWESFGAMKKVNARLKFSPCLLYFFLFIEIFAEFNSSLSLHLCFTHEWVASASRQLH